MSETIQDLNALWIFTEVVRAGGFTAAARATGLPKSTVSRKVRALERELGVALLFRSTRQVRPTELGAAFFERCEAGLRELLGARALVCRSLSTVRGKLRVTAPVELGQRTLSPLLPGFLARYPEVEVELLLLDRTVDMLAEGFDIALRVGPLPDSSLIARRLGVTTWGFVAAPGLEVVGPAACPWLAFTGRRGSPPGHPAASKVRPRLAVNDFGSLLGAARAGLGVACVPLFLCGDALRTGELVRVFEGDEPTPTPVFAVFPPRHALMPKVRSFLGLIGEAFAGEVWRG